MSIIRRAILALVFIAGISPAIAQAPPAVPGFPDTERRTSYTISGSTCSCAVNFQLYGDSTDYQNWIEVWLNGVRLNYNDATYGWTITSPTGSLATIPRPITDAVLTFTNAQTGTVQIVGAERPRRTSQFSENRGVAARDLNQALTYAIASLREIWDKTNDMTGRGLFSQPGNTMGSLPVPTACIDGWLNFGADGLTPVCLSGGPGSGNVVGPVTAPTPGDFAVWGPTAVTLADGGAPGTLAFVNGGTGVAAASANALNASGGLVGFGGNVGAASGASLALGGATIGSNALAVTGGSALSATTATTIALGGASIGGNALAVTGLSSLGSFVVGTGFGADILTDHGQPVLYFPSIASDPGCACNTFLGNGGANLTHAIVNTTAPGVSTTATVTISIASPGVITWTAHGLAAQTPVAFTSTGALPTGITAGTTYYVSAAGLTTNTFEIAATQGGAVINTTGTQSGTQTGYTISLEGRYNISLGQQSLPAITNGAYDTSAGFEGMFNCTSCAWNTGFGEATLFSNVTGNGNAAFGWKALLENTDSNNAAFGFGAMLNQTVGQNNAAFGYRAQYGTASATMAGDSSFGANAGTVLSTGTNNSFFGYNTGSSVTSGSSNTLLGANNAGSATLANEIQITDGTGALGFRSDSSRNTYLGDGATARRVYNYFSTSTNNAGTRADSSGVWHVFTGTSSIADWISVYPDGGVTIGAPTSADPGAGGINVAGPIQANGVSIVPVKGTWTPTPTNLTVVAGTGGATYAGKYTQVGNIIYWEITVAVTGTATTASTANSTTFTLPTSPANLNTGTAVDSNVTSLGVGLANTTGFFYPPTWSARNATVYLSGWYFAS